MLFFSIIQSIGACLGRETARKLVRVNYDEAVEARLQVLYIKRHLGELTEEECTETLLTESAQGFLEVLKRESRRILRQKVGADLSSRKR